MKTSTVMLSLVLAVSAAAFLAAPLLLQPQQQQPLRIGSIEFKGVANVQAFCLNNANYALVALSPQWVWVAAPLLFCLWGAAAVAAGITAPLTVVAGGSMVVALLWALHLLTTRVFGWNEVCFTRLHKACATKVHDTISNEVAWGCQEAHESEEACATKSEAASWQWWSLKALGAGKVKPAPVLPITMPPPVKTSQGVLSTLASTLNSLLSSLKTAAAALAGNAFAAAAATRAFLHATTAAASAGLARCAQWISHPFGKAASPAAAAAEGSQAAPAAAAITVSAAAAATQQKGEKAEAEEVEGSDLSSDFDEEYCCYSSRGLYAINQGGFNMRASNNALFSGKMSDTSSLLQSVAPTRSKPSQLNRLWPTCKSSSSELDSATHSECESESESESELSSSSSSFKLGAAVEEEVEVGSQQAVSEEEEEGVCCVVTISSLSDDNISSDFEEYYGYGCDIEGGNKRLMASNNAMFEGQMSDTSSLQQHMAGKATSAATTFTARITGAAKAATTAYFNTVECLAFASAA